MYENTVDIESMDDDELEALKIDSVWILADLEDDYDNYYGIDWEGAEKYGNGRQ